MLQIIISPGEQWDAKKREFVYPKGWTLQLEHSLVSLSKWEQKYKKPFLTKERKTIEETIEYIRCMTITQNIPAEAYSFITNEHIDMVNGYIEDSMTATWFHEEKSAKMSSEQVTAELIYYWMITYKIPVEFQKWHLNRLLTLIKVCDVKNQPPKKMSKREIFSRNKRLNEMRRKKLNSKG